MRASGHKRMCDEPKRHALCQSSDRWWPHCRDGRSPKFVPSLIGVSSGFFEEVYPVDVKDRDAARRAGRAGTPSCQSSCTHNDAYTPNHMHRQADSLCGSLDPFIPRPRGDSRPVPTPAPSRLSHLRRAAPQGTPGMAPLRTHATALPAC